MGILGSKEKASTSPAEESPKEVRRKHIELLGREFSVVKDGLDPKEVIEFLEASAGSSEAAFKHLEQFSAFQSVARTMEESISEARQMAEQAKAKARIEVDRERAKAIVEVQQQSSAILDETMRSCMASVEGIHSVILDAVAKTEEIQHEAFKKTREMVATNIAGIQRICRLSWTGNIIRWNQMSRLLRMPRNCRQNPIPLSLTKSRMKRLMRNQSLT